MSGTGGLMMKKLKCKCGGYPEPLYRKSKSGQRTKRGYLYKCRVCGKETALHKTKAEAKTDWNRRSEANE